MDDKVEIETIVSPEAAVAEKKKYAEEVKGTILNALAENKSFLQKDRKGIDYSLNCATGTVYSGVNQAYLEQVRVNNDYKNPHFMTFQQVVDRGMLVMSGQKGHIINYWVPQARYQRDEYPIDPKTQKEDRSMPIIHAKGSLKLDKDGKPYGENEYNFVFNLQQINPDQHHFRIPANAPEVDGKKIGTFFVASKAFLINDNVKLDNPYVFTNKDGKDEYRAKPGMFYKAKDDSIIERFAEDMSRYFNSCVTGAEFKAVKYTPEEIKTLQAEINNRQSPIFSKINDAALYATGQNEKAERIETKRQEKANENENTHKRGGHSY